MRKTLLKFLLSAAILLVAIFGLSEALDLRIGPIWVFLGIILVSSLLVALVKFPAAFIVPILFISRGMELPVPTALHGLIHLEALSVGVGLLGAACFLRLLSLCSNRQSSIGDLFRNRGKGILIFVLFAVVVTISYTYTRAPLYGSDKLWSFLIIGGLSFFAPFILLREEKDFRHFALATVGLGLLLVPGRLMSVSHGSVGPGENVVHIGIGQLIGLALLLVMSFRFSESRLVKFLALLSLPVLAAGLIAAEARAPLFALLLVLGAFTFTRQGRQLLISSRLTLIGIAAIVAAAVIIPAFWFRGDAAAKYRAKTAEVVGFTNGTWSDQTSGGRRLVLAATALHGIADKPIIGWGVGGWSTYYAHDDAWQYPHNLFLEVWLEEGLLGLAALAALLWMAFKAAKRAFDEASGRFAFVLPALAYCLLITMTSGDIDDNRFLWFWCGVALVAYRMIGADRQEELSANSASVS